MKHSFLISMLFLSSIPVFAVTESDWFGHYKMSHNGARVQLTILGATKSHSGPTLPAVTYVEEGGRTYLGEVAAFDQDFQHMIFYVDFPSFRQRFDAYLFTEGKNQMVGTTVLGSTTLGFMATKESSNAEMVAPDTVAQNCQAERATPPQVNIRSTNGAVFISRTGDAQRAGTPTGVLNLPCMTCSQSQPATPPSTPNTTDWLDQHNNSLLGALRSVVAPDQVDNQLQWEKSVNADVRRQIEMRTDTLQAILTYLNGK